MRYVQTRDRREFHIARTTVLSLSGSVGQSLHTFPRVQEQDRPPSPGQNDKERQYLCMISVLG